jgi:hypothetical protein
MNVNVVEGDRVRLCPSSAHAPDLVAALIVVPMLVVSGIWHCERQVLVAERISREVLEVFIAEFFRVLYPAVYLSFESPVEDFISSIIVGILSDPFKALGDVTVWSVCVFISSTALRRVESC